MYYLKVVDYFSSAHRLRGYQGKCEELHGHNWKVEVEVQGMELNAIGLLMDFKDLKSLVKQATSRLDHVFLNDLSPFKNTNPSSELIARHIHDAMKSTLPSSVQPRSVTVWESENACAVYSDPH